MGFYNGDNNYKIRFMPEMEGVYTYTTISNDDSLVQRILSNYALSRVGFSARLASQLQS